MTFTLLLRRSTTPGHAPTTSQLNVGELSLNTNDGILYYMKSTSGANSIVAIGPVPATANALTNAVTIALSGDATGAVSFNGANNVTIATTLASVNANIGTFNTLTVNAKGLVTAAAVTPYLTTLVASGDASGTSSGNAITLTLASVNAAVGTYGTTTIVPTITVNAKGLITAVTNAAIVFPVVSVFGRTGNVVLQSADVTGALGYVPVNNAVLGVANGVATLNSAGQLTASQLPSSTIYGAITASGDTSGVSVGNAITLTLASVNTNIGTFNTLTVNAKGLVTAALNTAYITNVIASGDASGTSVGNAITLTLASVNANIGLYGGSLIVPMITVNAKGLITAVANTAIAFPVTSVFGRTGAVTLQSTDVTTALGYTPVNTALLGVANGVATLNSSGQLTASQLPSSITGALVYQGTWNAATNTPSLVSSTGTKGQYYKVSVAGGTILDGISVWYVGDTAVFDGSTWDKIDGIANEVVSVNGLTGNVTLTVSNIGGAAPLASPALTGVPTAPTPALSDTSNTVATTAYVKGQNYVQGPIVASGGDATGTSTGNAITLTLASVNSTVGTYGTTTIVPTITVNAKGLVTAIANAAIAFPVTSVFGRTGAVSLLSSDVTGALGYVPVNNAVVGVANGIATLNSAGQLTASQLPASAIYGAITASGDATGVSVGNAITLTLASVNATIGTYGAATIVPTITVNAKGLVTAVTNTAIAFPVTSVFGRTGAVSLLSLDVTGALGYTPVNNAVVGATNGVATLDATGHLTTSQLPTSAIYGAITASGDVSGTSVGNAITLTLASVITAGTYAAIVVNAKGLVTAGLMTYYSGDVTGTTAGPNAVVTLNTVNSTPGTYVGLTINGKGLVTASANVVTFAGYNLGVGLGPDIIDGGSF